MGAMIPFNQPAVTGKEIEYIQEAIRNHWISGNHLFVQKCTGWLKQRLGREHILLTSSGTHALEMAALLLDIRPGDEVILPSFTFVSTANAFVLRGATAVFVDIRPDTMNMDEALIEQAVTPRTRAIVPVHYGGVACAMDAILEIARKHGLAVVEDAAHGLLAQYKGKYLGTMGDLGIYSFHETKNFTSGEGGALVVNNPAFAERAQILRDKGTNRAQFLHGLADKYSWVDLGSSYAMSELNAAYLYANLEAADVISARRMEIWNAYADALAPLAAQGKMELPAVPEECRHNAHLFYVKLAGLEQRNRFIRHLREWGVHSVFHYVPLHSSPGGRKWGRMAGEDKFTTRESERLARLPLFFNLSAASVTKVITAIQYFQSQ